MDSSEFAMMALEWEKAQRAADVLKAQLEAYVFETGESQKIGNVRITYRKGTRKFDYKSPVLAIADDRMIDKHSKTTVDWRSICKEMEAEPIVVSQSEPSVLVKIENGKR